MVLPGQPSTPEVMFRHYDFGQVASTLMNAGRIKPFIAVFPPLMTDPPRDTECTNIPGGPQAYSWLSTSVPDAVRRQLRAQPGPWSLAGWSTGAFCSAKLMLTQPKDFQAAVSLGASGWQTFWYVTLPNIRWGLLYGVLLCNARAMGEFGAVSVVSGHIRGLTNTMPLHVEILYNEYNSAGAFAVASLLAGLALVTLVLKTLLEMRYGDDIAASRGH